MLEFVDACGRARIPVQQNQANKSALPTDMPGHHPTAGPGDRGTGARTGRPRSVDGLMTRFHSSLRRTSSAVPLCRSAADDHTIGRFATATPFDVRRRITPGRVAAVDPCHARQPVVILQDDRPQHLPRTGLGHGKRPLTGPYGETENKGRPREAKGQNASALTNSPPARDAVAWNTGGATASLMNRTEPSPSRN